jgi:hypothetical protein
MKTPPVPRRAIPPEINAGEKTTQVVVSTKTTNAVPRGHPTVTAAMKDVAKQYDLSYELKILSATEVEMHFPVSAKGADNKIKQIKTALSGRLSPRGWVVLAPKIQDAGKNSATRDVSILVRPEERTKDEQ